MDTFAWILLGIAVLIALPLANKMFIGLCGGPTISQAQADAINAQNAYGNAVAARAEQLHIANPHWTVDGAIATARAEIANAALPAGE